ncbi:uncharacterized protein BDW43DRAFT_90731 [Aspergillus alliaceus]|uniref:uncharacterized protein n=1 Tax=Petromyces alliaceus TaxID=209559 RepID=UPI0012A5992F|nr:uncharacterized protein BDW43DRAFT_90731 [Aspergillus alliaceus]KAB8233280.1 hypothetical protein BDW43DRAFT_90731 [Aspergillus alliaceus]
MTFLRSSNEKEKELVIGMPTRECRHDRVPSIPSAVEIDEFLSIYIKAKDHHVVSSLIWFPGVYRHTLLYLNIECILYTRYNTKITIIICVIFPLIISLTKDFLSGERKQKL